MNHWGPLAQLAGEWEGDQGLDVSHHHAEGAPGETPYRETVTFKPFGPVVNGRQSLFGLDYRMAAWRMDEEDPFHTEVGYWLWCADSKTVMRAFVIPRGSAILAGGTCEPDATEFTMEATGGDEGWGMSTNPYLVANSKCTEYRCTVIVDGDTFSYDEVSMLDMREYDQPYHHTDRNTLRRVAELDFPPVD